jgi:polyhydroxybutyrate depolymerase
MRRLALTLGLAVLTLASPAAAETIRLGDRWYDIVLPAKPEGAPLILALHGGGGDPDQSPFPQARGGGVKGF